MKKQRLLSIFLTSAVILSGCARTEDIPEADTSAGEIKVYSEITGDYPAYAEFKYDSSSNENIAVSKDGRIIVTKLKKGSGLSCGFIEYSMDGTSRTLCNYPEYPDSIAFMGDDLYIAETWDNKTVISKLDLETGKKEEYATAPIKYCFKMRGNENELYILGDDPEKEGLTCNYGNFTADKKSVFRISGGTSERLPVNFPTGVCARKSGGAVIAACDDNGYYIAVYENGGMSENIYTGNMSGYIGALDDIDGTHIIYSVFKGRDYCLCVSDVKTMNEAEIMQGKMVNDTLFSVGDYCFFESTGFFSAEPYDGHKIERIKLSEYYKAGEELTLISGYHSQTPPYGCGYTINVEQSWDTEMALKILSQDKDFDLAYVNTVSPIAYGIKNKGSFYPLNEVEGIQEYMEKCLPYIREAFIDENGDIWAVPIHTHSTYIIRNTGDADFGNMRLPEFADYIDGLSDEDFRKTYCDLWDITEITLLDQVTSFGTFDTPEFREAAEKLRGSPRLNWQKDGQNSGYDSGFMFNETEHLMSLSSTFLLLDAGGFGKEKPEFDVCGIPCAANSNVVIPSVIFLCVNPYSEHLDDALGYISKLIEYQQNQPDEFILSPEYGVYSDRSTVKQMLELCGSAEIRLNYPDDVYLNDFKKYLLKEISLDDFIKEADRKLRTYLNE